MLERALGLIRFVYCGVQFRYIYLVYDLNALIRIVQYLACKYVKNTSLKIVFIPEHVNFYRKFCKYLLGTFDF